MKKSRIINREEKILRELLLDVNQLYLFIPRNISEFDDIEQNVRLGLLKFFCLYFALIAAPISGLIGFFYSCINDERMTSEILMAAFHFMVILFPFGSIFIWAGQSRNLIKLTHLLPRVSRKVPKDLMKMYRLANLKRKLILFFTSTVTSVLIIFNYFTNAYSAGQDRTGDERYLSGMLMPQWFPFETNYFPVKQLLMLAYFMAAAYLCSIFVVIMLFLFVFSGFMQCRVHHLIRMMKKTSLNHNLEINIVSKNLNDIMVYHTEIARSFEAMNDICGSIILPNFFFAAPSLSLLLTISFKEFNLMVFLQFVSTFLAILYVSGVVQQIPDAGEELYNAAYDMDWYDMDYHLRKTFLIFLMKVQKPLVPTTIFAKLDNALYMATMKCTYTYFMYLNNSKKQ